MQTVTIAADGDSLLRADDKRKHERTSTTFSVTSNVDVATITIGYANAAGTFVAYADGVVTTDGVITHGPGIDMMVRTSGITANSVVLSISD